MGAPVHGEVRAAVDEAVGVEEVPPVEAEAEVRVRDHVVVDPHLLARRDGRVVAQHLRERWQERRPGLDVGVDEAEEVAVVARSADRVQRHSVGHDRLGDTSMISTTRPGCATA